MISDYKWTKRMSILTPILAILCIFLAGGGHGWYEPIMILFPWAMINIIWDDHLSIPLFIAGAFQFGIYGLLIDLTKNKKNSGWVIFGILLVHIALVIALLCLRDPAFK